MKRSILYVVIAVAAMTAGIAGTLFSVRPGITKLNDQLTEQVLRNKELETSAKAAGAEIARLNGEIAQAKAEIEQLKAGTTPQQGNVSTEQSASEQAAAESSKNAVSEKTAASGAVRLYKVKEGDSIWKIAAAQLGAGSRYKEIVKLNPGIPAGDLKVGMELKIPAK